MTRKSTANPTEGEMDILRILWERGPSTVKEVNDVQNEEKAVGYTTTLKIMQIMTEKGLLKRRPEGRGHVYRAMDKPDKTRRRMLDSFLDSAFGGSAAKLVMQALGTRKASAEEIRQIRELLDRMDNEGKR